MTRPHDMGGRFGDPPVHASEDEPVFVEDWHARALALTLAAGALGQWNIDISRHAREKLSPKDYARFSYYEKWLAGLTDLLVETGVVSEEELAGADPDLSPLAPRALEAEQVAPRLATGAPADRPSDMLPAYKVGDSVKTRRISVNRFVDGGHTRLPNYAAGVKGASFAFMAHMFCPTVLPIG